MPTTFDIQTIPGRPPTPSRPLMVGAVCLTLLVVGSVLFRFVLFPPTTDLATYRLLSTVNYGQLFLDGKATAWLTTPITLTPGTHVLALHAPPFTIACSISFPRRVDDDCVVDDRAHTLTLAPRIADLSENDRATLSNYGSFPHLRFDTTIPRGALFRSDEQGNDIVTVKPAATDMTFEMWAGLADMAVDVDYGDIPGYTTEKGFRDERQDARSDPCPTYPLCDGTSILPNVNVPPYVLLSVPLYSGLLLNNFAQVPPGDSSIYEDFDRNIARIDIPLTYNMADSTHWQIAHDLFASVVRAQFCDFERSLFSTYVATHYGQYVTLEPEHGCQATIKENGGRLVITNSIVYLDAIAHQAYPAFPTFVQQGG